jgi:hypothetical protein
MPHQDEAADSAMVTIVGESGPRAHESIRHGTPDCCPALLFWHYEQPFSMTSGPFYLFKGFNRKRTATRESPGTCIGIAFQEMLSAVDAIEFASHFENGRCKGDVRAMLES